MFFKNYIIKTLEFIIRKIKKSQFKFDPNIELESILQLIRIQLAMRLRGLKLLLRFKYINGLQLGKSVRLRNIKKIYFGNNVRLDDYVYVDAFGADGVSFGDNFSIGSFSKIIVSTSYNDMGSFIKIGKNIGIGEYAYIGGAGGVEIGNDTIVGQYLSIHPENHVFKDLNTPIRLQGVTRKGIKIGQNVWIGSKVTILDGVNIGDGCIISAGSVLTRGEYKSNSIIAGNPAKVIKNR